MTVSTLSRPRTRLNNDRAAGVLVGTACGDALGAGYEFNTPMRADAPVDMIGGGLGGFAPGEWTDDTSMAMAVARAAADGLDLRSDEGLDAVAAEFQRWFAAGPADVGIQTRAVLSASRDGDARRMTDVSRARFEAAPRHSAGNGALMRTAAVALAYLDDPDGLVEAAYAVSDLTHADPVSGEACALWGLAIRHAVLEGTFDGVRLALDHLPVDRAAYWSERLDEAETTDASKFRKNGWVVQALQAAWSVIVRTPVPAADAAAGSFPAQHLQFALENAVRAGGDTDTVAAIAGGLLGAKWGVSAIPLAWQRRIHGWPGLRADDLQRLAITAARQSTGQAPSDSSGWPLGETFDYSSWGGTGAYAVHPHDAGVILSGADSLQDLPDGVDAVVSLCRLGAGQVPATVDAPGDHVTVWLVDDGWQHNPHLDYVLTQAAAVVSELRAEGKTVLLHCVAAQSRTPTVATLYSVKGLGHDLDDAMADVLAALPDASPNPTFRAVLRDLAG